VNGERKVFASLQAGRGIAAVAVVVHHAAAYLGDPRFWANDWYTRLFDFGAFGVEFFFVRSGIVILLAHWKDQGQVNSFRSHAIKRLRRIYPIYWVVLAAAIIGFQLKPMLGKGYERDGWVILSSILLVHIGSLETIIHVAWTLFHEIMFYVLFSAVIFSKSFAYTVLALWFCASGVMFVSPFGGPHLKEYLSPPHLFFASGMVVAVLIKREARLMAGIFMPPGIALLAYTCAWIIRHGSLPDINCSLLAGVASSLIFLDLMLFEREGRLRIPAWLNFLGGASYSIYLVHFPLLSLTSRACFFFSQRVAIPVGGWLLLQVFFAIVVGIGLHLAIENPILQQSFNLRERQILIPLVVTDDRRQDG
jgi:peptidoglycan/LPS O-acetylase OafA/YrhL